MNAKSTVRDAQELGTFLKHARRRLHLSQGQVAHELGITQAYVSELETGKNSLALVRMFDFMRLTGITVSVEIPASVQTSQFLRTWNQQSLIDICVRYGLAELAVFGSTARGQARDTSDVDLIYTLKPGMQLGWSINDLNDELEVLFGKSVDLVSKKTLRPALKAEVLDQAQVIYAA